MIAPRAINITKNSIDIKFKPPNKKGSVLIDAYQIQTQSGDYITDTGWRIQCIRQTNKYVHTFDLLQPGTIYHFRIRYKTATERGLFVMYSIWSAVISAKTLDSYTDFSSDANSSENVSSDDSDDAKEKSSRRNPAKSRAQRVKADDCVSETLKHQKPDELRLIIEEAARQQNAMQNESAKQSKTIRFITKEKNDLNEKCTKLTKKWEMTKVQLNAAWEKNEAMKVTCDRLANELEWSEYARTRDKKNYTNASIWEEKYNNLIEVHNSVGNMKSKYDTLINHHKKTKSKYEEIQLMHDKQTKSKNEIILEYKALQTKFQSVVKETHI